MAFILNATKEQQSVKALGNWFTLKPKQVKQFQDNIAMFLATERRDDGLVMLSEKFDDPEYRSTPEGKAEFAEAEARGIEAYIRAKRAIIYNNQVSLRQDLEKNNQKIDPAALASDGELAAMRLIASYQKDEDDSEQKKIDEVKELMKKAGPVSR